MPGTTIELQDATSTGTLLGTHSPVYIARHDGGHLTTSTKFHPILLASKIKGGVQFTYTPVNERDNFERGFLKTLENDGMDGESTMTMKGLTIRTAAFMAGVDPGKQGGRLEFKDYGITCDIIIAHIRNGATTVAQWEVHQNVGVKVLQAPPGEDGENNYDITLYKKGGPEGVKVDGTIASPTVEFWSPESHVTDGTTTGPASGVTTFALGTGLRSYVTPPTLAPVSDPRYTGTLAQYFLSIRVGLAATGTTPGNNGDKASDDEATYSAGTITMISEPSATSYVRALYFVPPGGSGEAGKIAHHAGTAAPNIKTTIESVS